MRENGDELTVRKRGEKGEGNQVGAKRRWDLTDDPATKSSLLNAPLSALVYYNERAARWPPTRIPGPCRRRHRISTFARRRNDVCKKRKMLPPAFISWRSLDRLQRWFITGYPTIASRRGEKRFLVLDRSHQPVSVSNFFRVKLESRIKRNISTLPLFYYSSKDIKKSFSCSELQDHWKNS